MRVTICSAAFLNCDCMAACLIQKSRRSVMWMSRMSFSTSSHHGGTAEANGTLKELKQSGRNLQFREMLSYGATEVERLLKARKSRLSLMEMFHFEHLQPMPKFQVILKADRKPERQNKGTIREG